MRHLILAFDRLFGLRIPRIHIKLMWPNTGKILCVKCARHSQLRISRLLCSSATNLSRRKREKIRTDFASIPNLRFGQPSFMYSAGRHKFIFLCGLHRSGTSPLFRILREHPQISGFHDTGVPEDEGQFLQSVFPAARVFGGPGRFGLARKAHLTENSSLVTSENREKLFSDWAKYWDLSKQYLLEKSPPNLIHTRFLQALFPNSYFVVILRHPIPVSLSTSKWTDCSLDSLVKHWLHCHDLFEVDRPHLKRVLVVRYEDLIRSTASLTEQICEFLDLVPYVPSPLDPAGNDAYFSKWRVLSLDRGRQKEFGRIIRKYERKVQSHGYSLLDHQ